MVTFPIPALMRICLLGLWILSLGLPADAWPVPTITSRNDERRRFFFFHCARACSRSAFTWHATPRDQGNHQHDEEMENEEETTRPYKSRSLAWTNRYRKLIPYESARARAISLGLRSKAEWDDFQETGESRRSHGPYLPSRPDLMYPDDWVSWEEFLGIMRPYDQARDLVRTLGIQNFEEYEIFVRKDKKRAEGLRIPAKPHIVYRDKGWTTFEDFFGVFD